MKMLLGFEVVCYRSKEILLNNILLYLILIGFPSIGSHAENEKVVDPSLRGRSHFFASCFVLFSVRELSRTTVACLAASTFSERHHPNYVVVNGFFFIRLPHFLAMASWGELVLTISGSKTGETGKQDSITQHLNFLH